MDYQAFILENRLLVATGAVFLLALILFFILPKKKKGLRPVLTPKKTETSPPGKTRFGLGQKLNNLLLATKTFDSSFVGPLEELLYTSDLGPKTVEKLLHHVRTRLGRGELKDQSSVKAALFEEVMTILDAAPVKTAAASFNGSGLPEKPWVILVVGINGAGKTTSIGKLAHHFSNQSKKVLIVAADTFRAAAGEQLAVWSERAQVEIYSSTTTTNPSAVAFEGVQKGVKENADIIIIDTAGRLHTKENLMDELVKTKRVMGKASPGAPHETVLVVDGNSGQNAVVQAKQFHEAIGVTSLIVTKLDGTARGGSLVAIADELNLGVQFVGLGEKMTDLKKFDSKEFAESLLDL